MHKEALDFLLYVTKSLQEKFFSGKVLDVGSGDINGNNRWMFPGLHYIGCDIYPAKNVDIVSKCHELPVPDNHFDVIVSSECFEHDMHYEKSITKIMSMLKPGGLFIFTCASEGRPEHGTRRTSPNNSFTCHIGDTTWSDYYKNLNKEDILAIPGFSDTFQWYQFYFNSLANDLYFIGIKKPYEKEVLVADYVADGVSKV